MHHVVDTCGYVFLMMRSMSSSNQYYHRSCPGGHDPILQSLTSTRCTSVACAPSGCSCRTLLCARPAMSRRGVGALRRSRWAA